MPRKAPKKKQLAARQDVVAKELTLSAREPRAL